MPSSRIPMADRVSAFRAFYRHENRYPLLGFFLGSEYPIPRYPYAATLPTERSIAPDDFDPSAHARAEALLFDAHEECGGYFIHSGSVYWGIPWLEALMGCSIRANHGTGSLYAEPIAPANTDTTAVAEGRWHSPSFDPSSPWAALAGAMLAELRKETEINEHEDATGFSPAGQAQGCAGTGSPAKFPLATTRMRGVADMLAAVFGGEGLILAMMERPDYVRSLATSLTDLYIAFGHYQLDRIPAFHGGVGSFYYSMWAPPGTVWHQEDSCMLLSPELYEEFIREQDQRIFAAFDGNIVHFHSTGGYLPIEPVLDLEPVAVELHRDAGGPSAEELVERHRQILDRTPLLIWGALTEADLSQIFGTLPAGGLAVQVAVESVEEAREIWDRWGGVAV